MSYMLTATEHASPYQILNGVRDAPTREGAGACPRQAQHARKTPRCRCQSLLTQAASAMPALPGEAKQGSLFPMVQVTQRTAWGLVSRGLAAGCQPGRRWRDHGGGLPAPWLATRRSSFITRHGLLHCICPGHFSGHGQFHADPCAISVHRACRSTVAAASKPHR